MGEIEIRDDNFEVEKDRIVGRTIVSIHRAPSPPGEWVCGQNHVVLTLDNGSEVHFDGWGYDASGVDMMIVIPAEVANG